MAAEHAVNDAGSQQASLAVTRYPPVSSAGAEGVAISLWRYNFQRADGVGPEVVEAVAAFVGAPFQLMLKMGF